MSKPFKPLAPSWVHDVKTKKAPPGGLTPRGKRKRMQRTNAHGLGGDVEQIDIDTSDGFKLPEGDGT